MAGPRLRGGLAAGIGFPQGRMMNLHDDKPFRGMGEVLRLSWPASLTMLNSTLMQFVDGLMVARMIGPRALSAQFVAAIVAFVPISLGMGLCTVVNTFVSQNLGARRLRMCGRYAWHGLYLAAMFGALMLPLTALAPWMFRGLAELIARAGGSATTAAETSMQTIYFQYLLAGASASLMARVMEQFFYGTHRPMIVYAFSVVSVSVNVALNYVLIAGKLGFPALGLRGAAIGTVAGWAVSFVLPLWVFLGRGNHRAYHTRRTWRLRGKLLGDLLRIGWPAGVQFCNDVFAWSIFNAALVGYFGELHKAASAAVARYLHVSFMPAIGIGIACTALVGKYIGQGRPDLARSRAHAGLALAVAYMGLCGLAFFLFRRPLVQIFANVPESVQASAQQRQVLQAQIVQIGAKVMICAAVFQCFDAVGISMVGALRGAGDTLWPMTATFVLSWGIIVGGGLAAIRWAPQWTSVGPWIASSAYVMVLSTVLIWRFESGAWKKIDLLRRPVGPARPAAVGPAHLAPGGEATLPQPVEEDPAAPQAGKNSN